MPTSGNHSFSILNTNDTVYNEITPAHIENDAETILMEVFEEALMAFLMTLGSVSFCLS